MICPVVKEAGYSLSTKLSMKASHWKACKVFLYPSGAVLAPHSAEAPHCVLLTNTLGLALAPWSHSMGWQAAAIAPWVFPRHQGLGMAHSQQG